ncbi:MULTISPECIES: hypothetical protein [Micrococcaceae]|uniref:hypothetical protein n=1 Tax=Micrococcaceae TaxID=1268 RepID=UPI00148743D0|nr:MULTISPECIES: hypothetical protein [Micrococcaceae]UEL30238.1 hypothetical protein KTR40_09235 [Pseudarthrobacter sp. L1SW]
MSERAFKKRPRSDKLEKDKDSLHTNPRDYAAPEPDTGVRERRRSGQFGYRPEDWPSR